MAKDKVYNRLIHTVRWLELRRTKLTASPLCERCKSEGRITAATEVHHITPVEYGLTVAEKQTLMYDYHNLMTLCHECHIRAHTEMGRSGKAATKRQTEAKLKRFKSKFID